MKFTIITSLLSMLAVSSAAPAPFFRKALRADNNDNNKLNLRLVNDKTGASGVAGVGLDDKAVKFSDAYANSPVASDKGIFADVVYVASYPGSTFSCNLIYGEKDVEFTFDADHRFFDVDSFTDKAQPQDLSDYKLVCNSNSK